MLAIDGPSGSGKSTFADAVAGEIRALNHSVALVRTDEFATWDDPVSWWPRLVEGVLNPLSQGREGRYRPMDWSSGVPAPGAEKTLPVPAILLLEGVSAARLSVRPRLSCVCWVELADPTARLDRAVARDGEASRRSLTEWQAFERGWFTAGQGRQTADKYHVAS
ncbi:uridine kinase [Amycolatopsis sp. cg5]|uniref:uridine kinase family protein n=1 Tax=Amycolatopsis sp. cg5 TaxID=3238802 RepID=UPI003524ED01